VKACALWNTQPYSSEGPAWKCHPQQRAEKLQIFFSGVKPASGDTNVSEYAEKESSAVEQLEVTCPGDNFESCDVNHKNDCGGNFNESEALLISHRSAFISSSNNEKTASSSTMTRSLDVGKYVKNGLVLPDDIKYNLLVKPWQPSSSYQFPKYARFCAGKQRFCSFQFAWLAEFSSLVYSEIKEGCFCKFCLLFAPEEARSSKLGLLVSKAVTGAQQYCSGAKMFKNHTSKEYHQFAAAKASSFLDSCKSGTVVNKISKQHQKDLQKKDFLVVLANIIHVIGKQGIPFRGHQDGGRLELLDQGSPT